MTDRELLEAAANAAGLDLARYDEELEVMVYPFRSELTDSHYWNPLTDDGDAMRLLVKFNMLIDWKQPLGKDEPTGVEAKAHCGSCVKSRIEDDDFVDPRAAIRRAIVNVAAEIGEKRGKA